MDKLDNFPLIIQKFFCIVTNPTNYIFCTKKSGKITTLANVHLSEQSELCPQVSTGDFIHQP